MSVMESKIIHLSIERPWKEVYAFASDPVRMPEWAGGLANGLRKDGEEWIATGPLGAARIAFAPPNDYGVIDHIVTLPNGSKVFNALRVMPNGDGAEIAFTLLRQPQMTQADFEQDAAAVLADLNTLKAMLEHP